MRSVVDTMSVSTTEGCVASLAEIEISTLSTLISRPNNGIHLATIANDVCVHFAPPILRVLNEAYVTRALVSHVQYLETKRNTIPSPSWDKAQPRSRSEISRASLV
mmetsp:Transcript_40961/g.63934  ORF Transcript_40961/g.63934 Transcript_40961/m.63934 type:complete len:106 (-) Transcript_40961:733-1050(-)